MLADVPSSFPRLIRLDLPLERAPAVPAEAHGFETIARVHRRAAAFDSISDAILVLDCDGRVEDANCAAARLFGELRTALLGRWFDELLVRSGDPALRGADALPGGRWQPRLGQRPNGTVLPVEVRVRPLVAEGLDGTVVTVRKRHHHRFG